MATQAGLEILEAGGNAFYVRDGKPWIALGSPGGHTIVQTVPQIVMNMIDFRMDVQQAIAAPRLSFVEPDITAAMGR